MSENFANLELFNVKFIRFHCRRSGKYIIRLLAKCMLQWNKPIVVPLHKNSFLVLTDVQKVFEEKSQESSAQSIALFGPAWKVEELKCLLKVNQELTVEAATLLGQFKDVDFDHQGANTSRRLAGLRKKLASFISSVSRFEQSPATHIFVFMISDERRSVKPYSLPIQCIPYHTMNDATMRRLVNDVLKEMKARGMNVAGMYRSL